jgi:hypothetical protein
MRVLGALAALEGPQALLQPLGRNRRNVAGFGAELGRFLFREKDPKTEKDKGMSWFSGPKSVSYR